jgi:putative FmdB family regulatory protein
MTYEYECTTCKHQWEADQKITDAPMKTCPKCKKKKAKRLISLGSKFVLKGSGWSSDNYGS